MDLVGPGFVGVLATLAESAGSARAGWRERTPASSMTKLEE